MLIILEEVAKIEREEFSLSSPLTIIKVIYGVGVGQLSNHFTVPSNLLILMLDR